MKSIRAKGEGGLSQITRHGNVVWRATKFAEISPGTNPVRVAAEAPTRQQALKKLDENILKRRVATGMMPLSAIDPAQAPKIETVASWAPKWLDHRRPKLGKGTLIQYENINRLHIIPALGPKSLRTITRQDCRTFIEATLPAKTKPTGERLVGDTAIRQIFFNLKAMLEWAVTEGVLDRNPMAGLEAPSRTPADPERAAKLMKASETAPQKIAKVVKGDRMEARWLLALFALRQGEALAVTTDSIHWADDDSQNDFDRLDVYRQMQWRNFAHGCGTDPKTGKWKCGKPSHLCPERQGFAGPEIIIPKSGSRRALPIVEPLKSALVAAQANRLELSRSKTWKPLKNFENLLFTTETGEPIRHQSDRRAWKEILKEAGVKETDLKLHEARHLTATAAMMRGFTQAEGKAFGGWKTDAMLANYAHIDSARLLREAMGGYSEVFTDHAAVAERQAAEAIARMEALEASLREQGIDPDSINFDNFEL